MSADQKVLAEMDCFHCYYRFRDAAGQDDGLTQSRYEAWLDYKQAVQRRDGLRCSVCGRIRSSWELDVRRRRQDGGPESFSPDNLDCVCVDCKRLAGDPLRGRRHVRLA